MVKPWESPGFSRGGAVNRMSVLMLSILNTFKLSVLASHLLAG